MPLKVLICDKIAEQGIKILERRGLEVTPAWDKPKSNLPEIIQDYDALIVRSATKVPVELIENAQKLKVIGRAGDGLDNIDTTKAKEKGIVVVNTPYMSTTSVAELTIGHIIALSRNIVEGTLTLREGKWAKEILMGTEVQGKTLGLIGCGNIGRTVERLALALGMRVLVVESCVFDRFIPIDDMLPEADYISVHVPLTAQTRHMISFKEFSLMKEGIMIINCSRGGVIDEEALYQALTSGKVKAAALDVFEEEPPRNNKLLTLSNVIATPHLGAQTYEAQIRASQQIATKVADALERTKS